MIKSKAESRAAGQSLHLNLNLNLNLNFNLIPNLNLNLSLGQLQSDSARSRAKPARGVRGRRLARHWRPHSKLQAPTHLALDWPPRGGRLSFTCLPPPQLSLRRSNLHLHFMSFLGAEVDSIFISCLRALALHCSTQRMRSTGSATSCRPTGRPFCSAPGRDALAGGELAECANSPAAANTSSPVDSSAAHRRFKCRRRRRRHRSGGRNFGASQSGSAHSPPLPSARSVAGHKCPSCRTLGGGRGRQLRLTLVIKLSNHLGPLSSRRHHWRRLSNSSAKFV